jgi:hypothetical protein
MSDTHVFFAVIFAIAALFLGAVVRFAIEYERRRK